MLVLGESLTAMGRGRLVGDEVRGVYHDGVGYYFMNTSKVVVRSDAQRGSWKDLEENSTRREQIKKDVFALWIDHGARPIDATYAYVVMPGMKRDTFALLSEQLPVQVVANQADLQAVVFPEQHIFQAGRLQVLGTDIQVNVPCLVVWQQRGDHWLLSVSDPTQKRNQIRVILGDVFEGEGAVATGSTTVVAVDLPQNEWAGKTVTVALKKR